MFSFLDWLRWLWKDKFCAFNTFHFGHFGSNRALSNIFDPSHLQYVPYPQLRPMWRRKERRSSPRSRCGTFFYSIRFLLKTIKSPKSRKWCDFWIQISFDVRRNELITATLAYLYTGSADENMFVCGRKWKNIGTHPKYYIAVWNLCQISPMKRKNNPSKKSNLLFVKNRQRKKISENMCEKRASDSFNERCCFT